MKKNLTIFLVMILVMVGLVSATSCGETITENTILDNDVTNCSGNGVVIGSDNITLDCDGHTIKGDGSENGINIGDLDNVIIKNCNIQNFTNGISLSGADNNRIINNAVSSNTENGIHLHTSNNNTIINNAVSNSGVAFHIFDSSNYNTLINNTAGNCNWSINAYDDNFNENGIVFDSASYNTAINNTVNLNNKGIWIDNTWNLSSSNNVIYHNNFINNHEQAYVSGGSGNVFDLGPVIGGNHWSDHRNLSNGSQPYIFSGGQDNYPIDVSAAELNVDNETDCNDGTGSPYYCTIQAAIMWGVSGDTIKVSAGTYNENLMIWDKSSLTVESVSGAEVTVIDALDSGYGVVFEGVETVVFKGFTVENFGEVGIAVDRADSVQIEDNIITAAIDPDEYKWGIWVGFGELNQTTGTIKNNEISGCHWYDFDPSTMTYEDYPVSGIMVWAPNSELFISDNEIYNSDVGMDIEAGPGTLITNNYVHNNGYGFVSWNENPSINYNNIVNNTREEIYRTVRGSGTGILNAENNWWGTIEKSTIESEIYAIYGSVAYSPWYDAVFTTKYFAVDENGSVEYDEEGVGGVTITPTNESGEDVITINLESLTDENVTGEENVGIPALGIFLRIESDIANEDIDEIEIRIYYNESLLPDGVTEEDLRIYYYDGQNWVPVSTEEGYYGVNTSENYVWAITDHFSDFGIFGYIDDVDGIPESEDRCPGTVADVLGKELGTNRWKWNGTAFVTEDPKGKGPDFTVTMEDTQGCSCFQILDMIDDKMEGHRKFGCSISVMEDFIAGL